LIVASGVESDTYVLAIVLVDLEQVPDTEHLGIEREIGGPVGKDVGGGRGGCTSLIVFNVILLVVAAAATSADRFRLVVIASGRRVTVRAGVPE